MQPGNAGLLGDQYLVQAGAGLFQVGNQPAVVVTEGGFGPGLRNAVAEFLLLLLLLEQVFLHADHGVLMHAPVVLGGRDGAPHNQGNKGGNQ